MKAFWSNLKQWVLKLPPTLFILQRIPRSKTPKILRFRVNSGSKMRVPLTYIIRRVEDWGFFVVYVMESAGVLQQTILNHIWFFSQSLLNVLDASMFVVLVKASQYIQGIQVCIRNCVAIRAEFLHSIQIKCPSLHIITQTSISLQIPIQIPQPLNWYCIKVHQRSRVVHD